jgi:hypothetical protein
MMSALQLSTHHGESSTITLLCFLLIILAYSFRLIRNQYLRLRAQHPHSHLTMDSTQNICDIPLPTTKKEDLLETDNDTILQRNLFSIIHLTPSPLVPAQPPVLATRKVIIHLVRHAEVPPSPSLSTSFIYKSKTNKE